MFLFYYKKGQKKTHPFFKILIFTLHTLTYFNVRKANRYLCSFSDILKYLMRLIFKLFLSCFF